MQHNIPVDNLGPRGEVMAAAVASCVHCGFCLPACPTYNLLGEEMDSPRGRIVLMKEVLEGNLPLAEAIIYVDRCLGCVGCVPACPSLVAYGALLASFRAYAEERRQRTAEVRVARRLLLEILPDPNRFRLARKLATAGRWVQPWLPGRLAAMLDLLPDEMPPAQPLPYFHPARGHRRARVALLTGCVQQALAPDINWATLRVLARNGVEVIVPRTQGCCGALAMHAGEAAQARALASRNLSAFPVDVDAVITTAAGCGSGMVEYPLLFKATTQAEDAELLAAKVTDITTYLDDIGLRDVPPPLAQPLKVAYHDACHLAHAQGVRAAPRRLLGSIENLTVVEIPQGDLCCGSAGSYNLEQPEIARELGHLKARNALSTGADALVTGNIGCMIQIESHLRALERPLPIYHTVQVLDAAYATGELAGY